MRMEAALRAIRMSWSFAQRRRLGAIRFEPADDAEDAGVQQVEAVFGVLGERTRQIGLVDFRHLQGGFARAAFARRTHAENRDADQRNEARRPKRQACKANLERGRIHCAGVLRTAETPTHILFISEVNPPKHVILRVFP